MKKLATSLLFILIITNIGAQEVLLEKYNIMPWPREIKEMGDSFVITENFTVEIPFFDNIRINKGTKGFIKRLSEKTGVFFETDKATTRQSQTLNSLSIKYKNKGSLDLGVDESYQIKVKKSQITIDAVTDIGVLRALETLLQLVENKNNQYSFSGVYIKDHPRFPWRGLMIDVARHYEPMHVLKRNLDAMAAVKLNVFHWHLSDDQGFRVEVKSYPNLYQKASNGQYYTKKEIKEIVAYADNLGIRVVPEFDIPGHATSWLTAYPEIGSKPNTKYEIEVFAGIFDPTLDPTNKKTYKILKGVFNEMCELFPDSYFHIGGDENEGKDWDENPKIQEFKKKYGFKSNHDLQTYFNKKIQKILDKNNKIMMGWDEIFQPDLPKDVVIHSWRGKKSMLDAAKQGYKTVLSKGFYIDLLKPAASHYLNDPLPNNANLTEKQAKNILGGEATMWGELVTPLTIDSRIWPRTAAIAERLWSDASINDVDNMYKRLDVISFELERLGITHIRNKDVILRNITDNQDITALKDLMNVCEPLKGYTRNKGGTEYKSFAPFTLFADACTADAPEALRFNKYTNSYLNNNDDKSLENIKLIFAKWATNYNKLQVLEMNSKMTELIPLSKNLSEIANKLLVVYDTKKLSKNDLDSLNLILNELKKPYVDVELVITNPMEKLINNAKNKYLTE